MAEAVAVAIADAVGADFVAALFLEQVITAAAVIGASSAYSSAQKRKARNAYNASLKDREVMIRSAVAPRRVIYGRDKVSGPIVYAESTGDKGQYLHLVIALAAHECDAIEEVWFNDIKLPTPDGSGFITSGEFSKGETQYAVETVTTSAGGVATLSHGAVHGSGDFMVITRQTAVETGGESGGAWIVTERVDGWGHTSGDTTIIGLPASTELTINYQWLGGTPVVRIKKHLGGAGQVADADLVAESAGGWTAAHVGVGITYLYVRLEYDQEVFGQVGLPNISAVVRGRKVRDPRTGTTVWSDNAALCIANWLQDADHGFGASAGQVPDSEVIAAANICDETIDLEVGGATTQPRYTYNGSFLSDQAPRDVLSDLLSGMAGQCVWTQGRWLVRPGAYRAPSLTITADHLAGRGLAIVPKATRSDLINAVRVVYRDPSQAWAEVQAPLVANAMYQDEDGGRRRTRTIQLPGAMDHWRAQRLAKIELERGRQALTVQCTTNLRAYDLSPTDTATLQLTRYGWAAGKVFEIAERTWSPEGTLQYTGRETAAGVWAWNFGEATTVDLAPDTELPNPYLPPPALTGLVLTTGNATLLRLSDGSILARVFAQWDQSTNAFVLSGGHIEAQWKADTDTDWQQTPPMQGDAINCYIGPLPDGKIVLIRVRAINASGRSGPWTTGNIKALGKSALPSDVTGLAYEIKPPQVVVTWNHCPDADYAETELHVGASYEAGDFLSVQSGAEYQHPRPPNGVYTVWAVHRDTSGNISGTPASLAVTVDDSIDGNAKLLFLKTSGFVFIFPDEASVVSADPPITITAQLVGVTGVADWTARAYDSGDVFLGDVTLGGAGNLRTISPAQFVAPGGAAVHHVDITAELGILTDTVSIRRYSIGSTAWQWRLTNPVHPVFADSTGHVITYGDAEGTYEVYQGADRRDGTTTPSVVFALAPGGNPQGLTGVIDASTGFYEVTAVPDGLQLAFITLRATVSTGEVFDDVFKLIVVWDAEGATTLRVTPRDRIVLPVDQDLNVISYEGAWTDAQMIRDTADVTADWTLTAEFLNCSGTFLANHVQVTAIAALGVVSGNPVTDLTAAIAGQGWSVHGVGNVTWGGDQWWLLNSTSAGGAVVTGIVTSPDFTAFTGRPTGIAGRWNYGAYGAGKFVSVESVATGATTRVLYSSDGGATFATSTIGAAFAINTARGGFIYGDRFMVTGGSLTTTGYQSADADAWTSFVLPAGGLSLTHGEATTYAAWKSNELWITTNGGTSWTANLFSSIGLPAGNFIFEVLRFRGRWIVVPQNAVSELYVSTTGAAGTWVRVATPFAMRSQLLLAQTVNSVLYLICHDSVGGAERMLHTVDGLSFKHGGFDPAFPIFTNTVNYIATGYNLPYLVGMSTSLVARRINLAATSESEASVIVRANKAGELEQVAEIPVTKGSPPGQDVYTYSAAPAQLELRATIQGQVLSYAGKSFALSVRKNGIDDTANHTITWTSSNAGLVPTSGSGSVITVTSMADALSAADYNITISKPGLPVRTESLPVVKVITDVSGGIRLGAAFVPFTHVGTSIALRFVGDGRLQISKDLGAFVDIDYWALPVGAYGATHFVKVEQTGGYAITSGTLNSWLALTSPQDFVLTPFPATSGSYTANLRVFISQPTAGANQVFGVGSLELIIP